MTQSASSRHETETEGRGNLLLKIARFGVERAVRGSGEACPLGRGVSWLQAPGATFVTLRSLAAPRSGETGRELPLRGCIGTLRANASLLEDLLGNAASAALNDPRFAPVREEELLNLRIEVSLLGALEEVAIGSEAEALERLSEGRDGWFLTYGSSRSTFLPQVWESLPTPGEFLRQLKRKAGLPPDFWHPDLRLQRYRVEKWSEKTDAHLSLS